MAGYTSISASEYKGLLNKIADLERISILQSKNLAAALKEKNNAIERALKFEKAAKDLQDELRTTRQRLAAADIPPALKPVFRVGQIVRINGSDGAFFGYHKIIAWRPSPSSHAKIVYDFESAKGYDRGRSENWLNGTGEQYLTALDEGDYNG